MNLKKEKTVDLEESKVYTSEQVASIMQVSVRIIRNMCRSGTLDSFMTPAGYRIAGFSVRKILQGSVCLKNEFNKNI